jgi:hypothetical protein
VLHGAQLRLQRGRRLLLAAQLLRQPLCTSVVQPRLLLCRRQLATQLADIHCRRLLQLLRAPHLLLQPGHLGARFLQLAGQQLRDGGGGQQVSRG